MSKQINTAQGVKTPAQAYTLLVNGTLPKGSLLGILNQLEELPEGKVAAEYIKQHPNKYDPKLVRRAEEMVSGRPIGPKGINSIDALYAFLLKCGAEAQIRITVREKQARRAGEILACPYLKLTSLTEFHLGTVGMSGYWDRIPRSFQCGVSMRTTAEVSVVSFALWSIIETIELVSTASERMDAYNDIPPLQIPLSKEIGAILLNNTHIFYDQTLFLTVCREKGVKEEVARAHADTLNTSSLIEDMLQVFTGDNDFQKHFLRAYIQTFNVALAVG